VRMHIRKGGNPEILVLRWPLLNFNRLAGLGFCWLMGPLMFAAGMGWLRGAASAPLILPILGGLLAAAGLALLLVRHDVTIDRRERIVTDRWSILKPIKQEVYDFSDFNCVSVERERHRSNRGSYTCYPVSLKGAEAELTLDESAQIAKYALRLGEAVGNFMGLSLRNASGG